MTCLLTPGGSSPRKWHWLYFVSQEPTGPCQRDTKPQRKYAHCCARHLYYVLLYLIYIHPWSLYYIGIVLYLLSIRSTDSRPTSDPLLHVTPTNLVGGTTIVLPLLICADWSLFCWNQRASIIDTHNAQRSSTRVAFLDLASMFPLGMKVCPSILGCGTKRFSSWAGMISGSFAFYCTICQVGGYWWRGVKK